MSLCNTGSEDVSPEENLWQEEPLPIKSDSPASWDLVLEDLEKVNFPDVVRQGVKELLIVDIHLRDASGEKKYGVRLQPDNGRNAVKDAYKESLDSLVYLRTAIEERRTKLIHTSTRTVIMNALSDMYKAQIQIALGLRYVLNLERENKSI